MTIFTIGHSSHSFDALAELLQSSGVTAVADVRSTPYSRRYPQFNAPALLHALKSVDIAYVGLGRELGGRPVRDELFRGEVADYEAMARTDEFAAGIKRVIAGAERHVVALLCSEGDPLHCHRCLLVGRHLATHGCDLKHIHGDGRIETQVAFEDRMLKDTLGLPDMFTDRAYLLEEGYRTEMHRHAFRRN